MHTMPRPCVVMKFTVSVVTRSAAITKSPSFSRPGSSTTITISPRPTASMASAIGDTGGRAVAQRCDITSKEDLDALVDRAVAELGRLDAMCNVAGVAADGAITDVDESMLDRSLAVNLKGVVFGCQAALRVMIPQGSGSIVNVSST